MKRYVIFGDAMVKVNHITKITIEPEFNQHVELRLLIRISLKKGVNVEATYCVVSRKDIKEKFGTADETTWYEKGLYYDRARHVMEKYNYNDVLGAIRRALNDDAVLDAHEGDVLDFLDLTGPIENCKGKYLSLIRKSTDKEFETIAAEHEYNNKMRDLRYARNEDEQNEIYEEICRLHMRLYKEEPLTMKQILDNFEWAINVQKYWRKND